jgi:hypothetical protein
MPCLPQFCPRFLIGRHLESTSLVTGSNFPHSCDFSFDVILIRTMELQKEGRFFFQTDFAECTTRFHGKFVHEFNPSDGDVVLQDFDRRVNSGSHVREGANGSGDLM